MASGTWTWYGPALTNILKGDIDLDTATVKIALAATAYTPDPDTHDAFADVIANEVTGTNWATRGQTTTVTQDVDTANNRVRIFFSDISVNTVTLSDAKHLIAYKDTGTDATSLLIAYCTLDTALAPSAGTLAIDNDGTNGALRITY